MKRRLSLLVAVLVLLSFGMHARTPATDGDRVLSLCDVVGNWKDHHRQKVRIRAVLAVGPEMTWLYDPACKNGKGLVDVELRKSTKGAVKKLDQLLSRDKRAWVTLEGVFYGPETYQNVDPKLPPGIKERLEKAPRRYGHMDAFETMIEVTKVIEAREVAAEVPGPSKASQSGPGTTLAGGPPFSS